MIFLFPFSFWRNSIDFEDLDLYDFEKFENVTNITEMNTNITNALSPFTIPQNSISVLSDIVFNYCYGKMICLKDVKRWTHNFYSDLCLYLLEQGRYLQSYFRDVNNNIDKTGTTKNVTDNANITGTSDTKKSGSVGNSQTSTTGGNDNQSFNNSVGDTLTILDNQTTSTTYLASKNDESFSKGEIAQSTNAEFEKTDGSNYNLTLENGDKLSKEVANTEINTSGTYSPLEIAKLESDYSFKPFYDKLLNIIDNYFILGGGENYA